MFRFFSIVFLIFMLVGCTLPSFRNTAEEEAVTFIHDLDLKSNAQQHGETAPQPVLHGKRNEREGTVLLYSKAYPDDRRQFGYVWVASDGFISRRKQATYKEVHLHSVAADLRLAYDMHAVWESSGNTVIVFGAALDPTVRSVEVTFVTGETKRDALTEGMFAIMGPNISGVDVMHEVHSSIREIRALDAQGHVLQRFGSP